MTAILQTPSLRLHAGLLDDVEILLAFFLHEGGELLDRERGHVGAFVAQPGQVYRHPVTGQLTFTNPYSEVPK